MKINILIFFITLISSCVVQPGREASCETQFREARELVYNKENNDQSNQAALNIVNRLQDCPGIHLAVVDFKITLFLAMKRYSDGIHFIDSLAAADFTYGYKKIFFRKNFEALDYLTRNDSVQWKSTTMNAANELENYIRKNEVSGKEFEEVFTELFILKRNYLEKDKLNKEVDSLRKAYPQKDRFFSFLYSN